MSSAGNIVSMIYSIFLQVEIIAEDIKRVQKLPKIEMKNKNIGNSMLY